MSALIQPELSLSVSSHAADGAEPNSDDPCEALENLLVLHTSYRSEKFRDTLALVDGKDGTVISTLAPGNYAISRSIGDNEDKTAAVKWEPVFIDSTIRKDDISDKDDVNNGEQQSTLRMRADQVVTISLAFSQAISTSSARLAAYLQQQAQAYTPKTQSQVPVSTTTKTAVKTIRTYTEKVASLTMMAARFVGKVIGGVAGRLADNMDKEGDAFYLISQSIQSWSNVSDGLEYSFHLLKDATGQSMVEVVQKRYGSELGGVVGDVADISGRLVLIYFDARGVGRKAIMKTMLKHSFIK